MGEISKKLDGGREVDMVKLYHILTTYPTKFSKNNNLKNKSTKLMD